MESFEEQARGISYYKSWFWIPLASIYNRLTATDNHQPWPLYHGDEEWQQTHLSSGHTVFEATGRTPLYQLIKEAHVIHWWVIGLACVLHHQQSITCSIVNYIYQRHRHLVADDLLSPRRKTNIIQSVLVSNGTPHFFLQKTLLPKVWSQAAAVLNVRLSSNPLRILPNIRSLPNNFATAYNYKAYALFWSSVNAVKFTFGWDWKPLKGRV